MSSTDTGPLSSRPSEEVAGSSFEVLVEGLAPRVQRYLERLIADPHVVEDLTQETFAHVLLAARRPPPEHTTAWVFRIARNLGLDHLRRTRVRRRARDFFQGLSRQREVPGSAGAPARPDEGLDRREVARALRTALARIPESYRTAFVLREEQGMSYEEIAMVVASSPKTVSTRLFRARRLLREALGGRPGFEDWGTTS